MHKTHLRKVGGSVMLAVPPAILETLDLSVGSPVGVHVENGCLVVDPSIRPRYSLTELLAASDYPQPQLAEDREWVDAPNVGREIL